MYQKKMFDRDYCIKEKKADKDQELIQLSTTPNPRHHMGK